MQGRQQGFSTISRACKKKRGIFLYGSMKSYDKPGNFRLPDVGLLLLILHQVRHHHASETVIFFARSFAIDPLLPQL